MADVKITLTYQSSTSYKVEVTGMTVGQKYHIFTEDLNTDGTRPTYGYLCRYSQTASSSDWDKTYSCSSAYSKYDRHVYIYTTGTTRTDHEVGTLYKEDELPSGYITSAFGKWDGSSGGDTTTSITVSFYKNGGTWSSGSDPYTETTTSTATSGGYVGTATASSRISRTNYHLLGWANSATASSATYSTNTSIGPLGSNLKIYAVWEENPKIRLNAGEGRFDTNQSVDFHIGYGEYVYFKNYMPTRTGYKLIGWSANSGASSPTYGVDGYVGPLYRGSYTYYAVWQEIQATTYVRKTVGITTVDVHVDGAKKETLQISGWVKLTTDAKATIKFVNPVNATGYKPSYVVNFYSDQPAAGTSPTSTSTSLSFIAPGSDTVTIYVEIAAVRGIDSFYWENSVWDAANIAKGQPIANLTATRWNNLKAKVKELVEANGGSYTYSNVSSGATITADEFNQVRNKIATQSGAGTVPGQVTKGVTGITAALFEGDGSIKAMVNKAINAYNSK